MSKLIKNNNNKKPLSSLLTTTTASTTIGAVSARTASSIQRKYPTTKNSSSLVSLPSVQPTTSSIDVISSFKSSAISLFSMMKHQQLQQEKHVELAQATSASTGSGRKVFRTMPSFKVMSYQYIIALLTMLVCGLVTVNGLKCYMCGQYNEGVGSITPCLNYSEQYAHLYLKECSKKSEKYCVKYVSELSIVRDCATECAEKEIWETQTYCCTEDGCNGSAGIEASAIIVMMPLVIYVANEIINIIKQQRR